MKPGFVVGEDASGPLVTPASGGAHGYWPDFEEMNSSFFVMGPGVKPAKVLGTIDMRSIGPTLARFLGVPLPAAEEPALDVQ
jgi:hypothetical protein